MNNTKNITLAIENVDKYYGDYHALRNINFSVEESEFLVLVGPSGCGKSTLMRCIAGLEKIDTGTLRIEGSDVTNAIPSERGVAMVFQSYALYPHMTAAENIGFPLKIARLPKTEIQKQVLEAACTLKIENLLNRRPRELSGGQRQRVAIGRAIVHQPKIYLFDEPLSNLDAALRVEMRVELARLHNATGKTMIYVTHDQVEAMTMASCIVVMNDGNIEQIGMPLELFNNPANRFVAGFIGQPTTNFIKTKILNITGNRLEIQLAGGSLFSVLVTETVLANTESIELGIRPQFFGLAEDGKADLLIKIDIVEQLGDETLIYGATEDGQNLTVQVSGQHYLERNQMLGLSLAIETAMVFNSDGRNISPKQ